LRFVSAKGIASSHKYETKYFYVSTHHRFVIFPSGTKGNILASKVKLFL
jgi:hypothetical protein